MSRLRKQIFFPDAAFEPYLQTATPELPFVVRPVSDSDELLRIAEVRLAAYRIDLKNDLSVLSEAIDVEDYAENALVLAAFDKKSDDVLGTMRIAFSSRGPTTMQSVAGLPNEWNARDYGEARLLCVPKHEHSRMILLMLCKAFYLACRQQSIDHMLIGSRRAMEPFYEFLCFSDIADNPLFFTPPTHDMPHRIMSLRVDNLQHIWQNASERDLLSQMFFKQRHFDIQLGGAALQNPLSEMSAPKLAGETLRVSEMVVLVR
ncbi:MAG: hypothetical protein WBD51_02085 [Burkholderiaceae bacterium]